MRIFLVLMTFFFLTYNANSSTSELTKAVDDFKNTFSFDKPARSFDGEKVFLNSKKNRVFCTPNRWNEFLHGYYNEVELNETVEIEGTNIKDHFINNTPAIYKLYSLILEKVLGENKSASKYFLLAMAEANAFTKIKPNKFTEDKTSYSRRTLENYPPYKEQIAQTTGLLVAASLAIEIQKKDFNERELQTLASWGQKLLKAHKETKTPDLDLTKKPSTSKAGEDTRSRMAAGYITYGISTKNIEMLHFGLELFASIVEQISKDSTFDSFFKGHPKRQMNYHHQIVGYLVVSAHALKLNGLDVYKLKNANGRSLFDAIKFTIENSFENKSPKLEALEQDRLYLSSVRNIMNSMSWVELAYADLPSFRENEDFLRALNFRNTTATWVTESKAGFFGANMAGFTSCFFSILPPERALLEKVEIMNFYQNTTLTQRQCLFKRFSPDLLVMFKSNENLPNERLEQRRSEAYLSCKDS
jgi:hypothetical protein